MEERLPRDHFKKIAALKSFTRQSDSSRIFAWFVVAGLFHSARANVRVSSSFSRHSFRRVAVEFEFVAVAQGSLQAVIDDNNLIGQIEH